MQGNRCNQASELAVDFQKIEDNERRTLWVVILTSIMMVVEITAGYITGSMALLADGYHMASHAGALGIAYFVYKMARSQKLRTKLTFGTGKLLPLGGFASAIGLGIVAMFMGVESIYRFFNPSWIEFNEAIGVAVLGLIVNVVSVFILGFKSHSHSHDHNEGSEDQPQVEIKDHNHESAFMHVVADALTSVVAIVALIAGKYYGAHWLDPVVGVLGAIIILKWAYSLCKVTAWELLDGSIKEDELKAIRQSLESSGHKVLDLHVWKVGPSNLVGQLIVESEKAFGVDYYKGQMRKHIGSAHLIVEERTRS